VSRRPIIRRSAQAELIDLIDYIAQDDPAAAERVRDAVLATIKQLADNPGIGRAYPLNNPRLAGLRKWNVRGYPAYLIFYLEREDGAVEILHIIDGRRDLVALLEPE
jgi:toxin ParE1/3/4